VVVSVSPQFLFKLFAIFTIPACLLVLTAPISPVQYRHCNLCTVCASQYVRRQWFTTLFLVARSHLAYCTCIISGIFTNYVALPTDHPGAKFPPDLRTPTLELASSHLICSVALTGVLALQTGRWWAERADDDANDAEKLSVSGRGSGEKEGSKPEPKKTAQGEGAAGLATVST
jgi:ER membrane protein SH3